MSVYLRPIPLLLFVALAWGCSGPQPTETAPEPPETASPPTSPQAPPFEVLAFDRDGLVRIVGKDRTVVIPGARFAGYALRKPDGGGVVFSYAVDGVTHLARIDDAALRHLHTGGTAYSAAWGPSSSSVAFGYRNASRGDVLVSTTETEMDPGCSASTVAAHWPDAERLVTGDGQNRYVVSSTTCATFASVDIRKMAHITYAPGSNAMAYIYRDLVYDRAEGAYVPDSTLFISQIDGSDAEKLFDDAYRPRHLAWSPDGLTLAFDVQLQDPSEHRRVVLSDRSGGFTYLVPPSDFPNADVVRPSWSPSGRHVAFELRRGTSRALAVRTFGRTEVLAADIDSTWGWIDDETLAYAAGDDSTKAVALDGDVRFALGPGVTVLDVERAGIPNGD